MSTYLSCFIVSNFEFKSATIDAVVGDDFLMRVFATRAQLDKVDFALTRGKGITEFFIDYFQIAYPLKKLGELFWELHLGKILLFSIKCCYFVLV